MVTLGILLALVVLVPTPALAQEGDVGPLNRDWSDGDGGEGGWGCWICVPDGGFNIGCVSDEKCSHVGHEEHGWATFCQAITIYEGCQLCEMNGGACFNVEVHG